MISILSVLVHKGTHIDGPRHMIDKGLLVDPVRPDQFAEQGREFIDLACDSRLNINRH